MKGCCFYIKSLISILGLTFLRWFALIQILLPDPKPSRANGLALLIKEEFPPSRLARLVFLLNDVSCYNCFYLFLPFSLDDYLLLLNKCNIRPI
jgi:hypothetical protein